MKKLNLVIAVVLLFIAQSCSNNNEKDTESNDVKPEPLEETVNYVTDNAMEQDGIKIYPFTGSQAFPDATLEMIEPVPDAQLPVGTVSFKYKVGNFQLGEQTPGAGENGLAFSGKGQHIHLIINNEPYMAHYEAGFEKELEEGNYIILSFLSRSYHESIKTPTANMLNQITVGDTVTVNKEDLSLPLLFYSRPKGTYVGNDANKLLLDFYLLNAELSKEGYKVRVTINSNTSFTIAKWQPYILEGLPIGENVITLDLLDHDGNLAESAMNTVKRIIKLEAAE
jgi:hypothetical protein